MDHKNNLTAADLTTTEEATPFRCPACMMGDTCGDCAMLRSDGRCAKYNHYTEPDHWACPWYYTS